MSRSAKSKKTPVGPIVSAAHLASGAMPAMSEMEFALNAATNAWHRWMVRCASAAGMEGLTAMDVLVLHHTNHRGREKTLADLCLLTSVEDTHLVNYSLKKLSGMDLVRTGRRGKEKTVSVTDKGEDACRKYHEIREAILIDGLRAIGLDEKDVSRLAALLRSLSGQYDQAARAAASF